MSVRCLKLLKFKLHMPSLAILLLTHGELVLSNATLYPTGISSGGEIRFLCQEAWEAFSSMVFKLGLHQAIIG